MGIPTVSNDSAKRPSYPALPLIIHGSSISGRVVGRKVSSCVTHSRASGGDLDNVEEHFGQLWFIPCPPRCGHLPSSSPPDPSFGFLCWIRKDLLASGLFFLTDCYPTKCRPTDLTPKISRLLREGIGPGSPSFAEVVKCGLKMSDRRVGGSSFGAAVPNKAPA